ncbi:MAG: hypothetical protein ACF8Q5_08360 [Phycisphaerales bacterium JB040]
MSQHMTRSAANQFKLVAQGVALVGVLCAVLIAILIPRSAPERRASLPGDPGVMPTANTGQADASFRLQPEAIEARLALLDNAPRVEIKEPEVENPVTDPETPVTTTPTGLASRVSFLGTMTVGEKRMALVSIDGGRQRVVAEDARLPLEDEDAVLKRADDRTIYIEHNGATVSIDLARADGDRPAFSTLAAPEGAGPGVPSNIAEAARNAPRNVEDRFGGRRRGGDVDSERDAAAAERETEDPMERRRQALQRAVENGTLSQERADEMMERAIQNQLRNARQPGRDND